MHLTAFRGRVLICGVVYLDALKEQRPFDHNRCKAPVQLSRCRGSGLGRKIIRE